jgi:hypothetical protein
MTHVKNDTPPSPATQFPTTTSAAPRHRSDKRGTRSASGKAGAAIPAAMAPATPARHASTIVTAAGGR